MSNYYDEQTQEKVKNLRIIDDTLFRLIAARKEVCQEILRTLLDEIRLKASSQAFLELKFRRILENLFRV